MLARLAVDTTFLGRGLGSALLRDCFRHAAALATAVGLKALLVHCRDDNARNFYCSRADFLPSAVDEMQLLLPMTTILRHASSLP